MGATLNESYIGYDTATLQWELHWLQWCYITMRATLVIMVLYYNGSYIGYNGNSTGYNGCYVTMGASYVTMETSVVTIYARLFWELD